ncbi:MAG: YheU family protein [Deltaproteobacteria bacterium]|nr:YheU family protein [Deltaproteobacteria bacterium]
MIPHRQLSADALRGVLEEFVTREGTDYGGESLDLAEKVSQVRLQLDRGYVVLVYDRETASCNIIPVTACR